MYAGAEGKGKIVMELILFILKLPPSLKVVMVCAWYE